MRLWEFYNSEDDELIEVEAEGFEEAYHIALVMMNLILKSSNFIESMDRRLDCR